MRQHIPAVAARDCYTVKIKPRPSDYDRVARWCLLTVAMAAGCMAVVAAALWCGWAW